MSLLERVRAGTKNFQIIAWPGTKVKVKMRVLSRSEFQEANFAAYQHFRQYEIAVESHTVEAYEDEKTLQLLWRALSEIDGDDAGKPVAANIDVFRAEVTKDEINALVECYGILEEECSPNQDRMPTEEFDAFLETLKKKPDEILGSVRSIVFAKRLLRSLVSPPEI